MRMSGPSLMGIFMRLAWWCQVDKFNSYGTLKSWLEVFHCRHVCLASRGFYRSFTLSGGS
jgi:hypothetical protein